MQHIWSTFLVVMLTYAKEGKKVLKGNRAANNYAVYYS